MPIHSRPVVTSGWSSQAAPFRVHYNYPNRKRSRCEWPSVSSPSPERGAIYAHICAKAPLTMASSSHQDFHSLQALSTTILVLPPSSVNELSQWFHVDQEC